MKIDFTMSGKNFLLFSGIAFVLFGISLLIYLKPLKHRKKYVWKDYVLLTLTLVFLFGGIFITVLGLVNAIPRML